MISRTHKNRKDLKSKRRKDYTALFAVKRIEKVVGPRPWFENNFKS